MATAEEAVAVATASTLMPDEEADAGETKRGAVGLVVLLSAEAATTDDEDAAVLDDGVAAFVGVAALDFNNSKAGGACTRKYASTSGNKRNTAA